MRWFADWTRYDMTFTQGRFLLFFALLLLAYYLLPRRLQKPILLLGSLAFYAFAGVRNLLLVLAMAALSFFGAQLLTKLDASMRGTLDAHPEWEKAARKAYHAKGRARSRAWMWGICALLVGVLIYFKAWPTILAAQTGRQADWLLPMGLSFFTFQMIGYVVDVYRGSISCERSLARFMLFALYFPRWIQGPISRYGESDTLLHRTHALDGNAVVTGAFRVLIGYAKKLIVADTALIAVEFLLARPQELRGIGVLVLSVLYSVQIYADFTGGMDIALGCSEMLGISLCENFDHPFSSTSIKEYWRRWHISMGRWFTDYVFYPLSLSRTSQRLSVHSRRLLGEGIGKRVPVWAATLITWLLTGLWHGFGWNFALWGLLNGILILVGQEFSPLWRRLAARFPKVAGSRVHHALSCTRVFLVVGLLRTLDLFDSADVTLHLWGSLFARDGWSASRIAFLTRGLGLSLPQWGLLVVGVGLMTLLSRLSARERSWATTKWGSVEVCWASELRRSLCRRPILAACLMAFLLFAVLVFGRYGYGYDPSAFIYNRF